MLLIVRLWEIRTEDFFSLGSESAPSSWDVIPRSNESVVSDGCSSKIFRLLNKERGRVPPRDTF